MVIKNILEIYNINSAKIDGAIISSVVPGLTNVLKAAVGKLSKSPVIVIGPGLKTGLKIATDNPGQLGSDLAVDAVAGIYYYGAPLIIIDMGTATTISAIDKDSTYVGTVIAPGVMVSLNSLVGGTSQLPKISLDPPNNVIGTNTVDCMKSGIMHGTASMLDGMIDKLREELGDDAKVVATGGLSKLIIPLCKREITIDDELLLKGLMLIYEKNV